MKKPLVIGTLAGVLVGMLPVPVLAGAPTDAALGLGAFAVFNQLVGGRSWHRDRVVILQPSYDAAYAVIYAAPPVVYASPPVVYAPTAPAIQREVVFPHGRYVLQGDGVTVAYRWVWVPNPPPPPPPSNH
jgi:hypothetical protein